jgi:hypothetical protein
MKGKDLAPSVVAWILSRAGTFIQTIGGPAVPAYTYARMAKDLKRNTGTRLSTEALRRIVAANAPGVVRKRKESPRVSKSYLVEPGSFNCVGAQQPEEAPQTAEAPDRQAVPRAVLWAIAEAARLFHRRTVEGRIGSVQHVYAAGELERALANIPQEAWHS